MDPIEGYLAELDRVLRGPRRAKADLLAEARDSLRDAAQSYMDGGAEAGRARALAVADFGEIPAIAPGFQAELSLAQARRTAMWAALAVVVQPLVWGPLRPAGADTGFTPAQARIDLLIDSLGYVTLAGAALALLACGIGVRFLGARHEIARVTGLFTLTVAIGFVVLGGAMLATTGREQVLAPQGLPWALTFLLAPMAAVALSARRCVA